MKDCFNFVLSGIVPSLHHANESGEVGAYMRLLCHSWLDDGIPMKSKAHLARLAGVSTSKLEQILPKFYIDDENRVRHHRLEEVRKSVADLREKRRKAGALGGKAS